MELFKDCPNNRVRLTRLRQATAKAAWATFSTDTWLKWLACVYSYHVMVKSVSCWCVCVCVEARFSQIQSQLWIGHKCC